MQYYNYLLSGLCLFLSPFSSFPNEFFFVLFCFVFVSYTKENFSLSRTGKGKVSEG